MDLEIDQPTEESSLAQVNEYEVLQELGKGCQGKVYKARNQRTSEIFAIKEVRRREEGLSIEAKTEIAVMKKLNHPNVARFIAAYESPDFSKSLFLVLEFVDGGSLYSDEEVWEGNAVPLSSERAQDVSQQLVRGISYLHQMGVLHRDIKPSNILGHRERGTVKVSDFGVSSFMKRTKSSRLLGEDDIVYVGSCGTPAFWPPEASGAGYDTVYHARPAEVWALGITIYFLLVGSLPFRGVDRLETARFICESPVIFPPKFPIPAKDLITKMLEKDPTKRATLSVVAKHPWMQMDNVQDELEGFPLLSPFEVLASVSSGLIRTRTKSFRSKMKSMVGAVGRRVSISSESESARSLLEQQQQLSQTSEYEEESIEEEPPKGLGRKLFLTAIQSDFH